MSITNAQYHDSIVKMEQAGVDPEYIMGWQNGYLMCPAREEQRVNDAYNAGFEKGRAKDDSGYETFVKA